MLEHGPRLEIDLAEDKQIFRIGFEPDPWLWSPWEFAPFNGRWDDPQNQYRVLYAGTNAFACFVEVLAVYRVDQTLVAEMAGIISNDPLDASFDTVAPGVVPRGWLSPRLLGDAILVGSFVDIQHVNSIATLRPRFIKQALALGLKDFDGAAIRLEEPRSLTQSISRHLYTDAARVDGVYFESRHGNDLGLHAVFERLPDEGQSQNRSPLLSRTSAIAISEDSEDFRRALELHGLILV